MPRISRQRSFPLGVDVHVKLVPAMERVRQAGISVVITEMAVFEWLNRGNAPEFRDLLALVE